MLVLVLLAHSLVRTLGKLWLMVRTADASPVLQAKIGASVSASCKSRRVVRPKQTKVCAMHVPQMQLDTCIAACKRSH